MNEIKDLLLTSKVDMGWKDTLKSFADKADECNRLLHKIIFFRNCRDYEKKIKANKMPYYSMVRKWEEYIRTKQNSYPGDLFYYPYKVMLNGHEMYFDDTAAYLWLKRLLDHEYKLQLNDYVSLACYALTLKKAFYELAGLAAQGANIRLELILHLYMILENVYEVSKNHWLKLVVEEKQRIINSQNASTRTPARIEDCKKHEMYPQLKQMIKSYQETPRELRNINELVGKIIDTENRVTIRRYRHLFFKEIKKR